MSHPKLPYAVHLMGGLGNQLFQLAAMQQIADSMHQPLLVVPSLNKHSSINYFTTIFSSWRSQLYTPQPHQVVRGYFQNHKLVEPDFDQFAERLNWDGNDSLRGYDEIDTSIFVHVRGGDYLQPGFNKIHHVPLENYYKRALLRCNDVKHAYVFTNDRAYLESLQCFDDIRHTVVSGSNEIHDLFLMSQCGKGGIAANSTFSWWGLYLDKHRPHLCLPDMWFQDPTYSTHGYYFPEASPIRVL